MASKARNPVTTSQKTIRVLQALYELEGARVTELASELDMNKSTVHNHLSTLQSEEFVVKNGTEYDVGLRLLEFGGYARESRPLYSVAAPEIERLADQTGELANLVLEEFGRGVYISCERGDRAVDLNVYPGLRRPLHITASGKAILAELPDERVAEILDRHGLIAKTEHTITNREKLLTQLKTISERGYAIDNEENIPGLRCVGAPILDGDGVVLGAISISAPTNRMSDRQFEDEFPDLVRSTANVIELNINYS